MTDTIAHQLHELTELHAQGSLTDEEFAAAKQRAITEPEASTVPAAAPEAPAEVRYFKFTWPWIVLSALVLVALVQTILGAGLEWGPLQRPAAPVLCAGGQFDPHFDVSYGASAKAANFTPTCTRDGVTRELNSLLVDLVLTIEFMLLAIGVLYALRTLRRSTRRGDGMTITIV